MFDREDKFAASESPLSRGENFDDDISFKHKNAIDADDESNDDFEKTISTKFELQYAEGGEECAREFDYKSKNEQEYDSVERDDKYQDADGKMGLRGAHCTASTSTAGRLRDGYCSQIWAGGEPFFVPVPT